VFSKKIQGVQVDIHKHNGQFEVKLDDETLDTYKNQKEAEAMAKRFIAQYKG